MAIADIKVQSVSLALPASGDTITYGLVTTTNAGANLTLTGLGSLAMKAAPSGFPLNGYSVNASPTVSLVSAASGLAVLAITGGAIDRGSYNFELYGTPSGGSPQVLATGNLNVT